jgi:hypothetical protein
LNFLRGIKVGGFLCFFFMGDFNIIPLKERSFAFETASDVDKNGQRIHACPHVSKFGPKGISILTLTLRIYNRSQSLNNISNVQT